MAALRIFVADDHEIVRRVITALLGLHPEWQICGEAADGSEAVRKVAQLKPDIVLLDIDMPNVDGLEATRQIVKDNPSRKVIVLTMATTEEVVLDVFHAGARCFVLNANATHDLPSAIEAVQRGQTFFTARFAELILKSYLQATGETGSTDATLTERERETVQLLTDELTVTLGHQFKRPRVVRRVGKYLAIAVMVVAGAGILWYYLNGEPDHAPPAVENLLVSLGLKSPPPPLENGNPNAKVWIDVHTALYYCRGADAFGKTSRGRIASQRDAQLDHFKPAAGKPCD
jgi:DNA-binding NarL/FixJ family response regulator